ADRVHMPPDLLEEQALLRATLGLGSGVRERGPRLVGELRVDRNDSPRVPHDGIDPRPVLVRVLDLVRGRREGIVKKPFAEGRAAALSGGPADDEGKRRQRHDRRQKRKQRREIHGLRLSSSETVSTSVRGKICVRERPCTTVAERWAFCVGAVERSANGSKRPDPSAVVPRISDLRLRNTWGER